MIGVHRVYTGAAVRELDRVLIEERGMPGFDLMERAGRGALRVLQNRWPEARSVTVVAGSGNNAGDGYIVAGHAKRRGLEVQLLQVGDTERLSRDAARAFEFARHEGIEATTSLAPIEGDVVVDALLGTGAGGAMRPAFQAAIDHINASAPPVLALDLPSGVDADTGALLTPNPVRADVTVTFIAAKLGLVTGAAVDAVGECVLDVLDTPEELRDGGGIRVMGDASLARLARSPGDHKGRFGNLLVVGGDHDMGGAVILAGAAALRTGAGIVRIATRDHHRAAILAHRPELMVRAVAEPQDLRDSLADATAIAVGPGLGRAPWGDGLLRAVIEHAVTRNIPVVFDADALNFLADFGFHSGREKPTLPPRSVLTPHPGEAGRLLGHDSHWIQQHRPEAVGRLSRLFGNDAVAVLKGAGTLVGAHGEPVSICLAGNPGLATPGSGDVLTGIIGALLARGWSPLDAAELGVYLHADAGDRAMRAPGPHRANIIASDIIDHLETAPRERDAGAAR